MNHRDKETISEEKRLRDEIPLTDRRLAEFIIERDFGSFRYDSGVGLSVPFEVLSNIRNIFQAQVVSASPEELKQAIADNAHAASLLDEEDFSKYQRFKVLIDRANAQMFCGISPAGELCGLVNNGPFSGIAAQILIPYAVSRGAKTLNAWNVNGRLQKMYCSFGFQVTKHIPYDTATYGEPSESLKKSWRVFGWTDTQSYPVVTHMSL